MKLAEELSKILSVLFGALSSGDQIANLCREKQIQGFAHNIMSDPMTKLVRQEIDFQVGFLPGKNFGSGQFVIFANDKNITIPAPYVCGEFHEYFKLDKYSDLVAFPNDVL